MKSNLLQSMPKQTSTGVLAALGAFIIWGLSPVYWKQLAGVPAVEILCHRIVWSFFFVGILVLVTHRAEETRNAFCNLRTFLLLLCTSILVGMNWLIFIWAVTQGHVLQASLGYYINPLVTIFLGAVFFKERLRPIQGAAIALVCVGVGYQLCMLGQLPWISLALALTFAVYGLLRKIVQVESIPGLMVETCILAPVSAMYLLYIWWRGDSTFLHISHTTDMFLVGAGVLTSVPLVGFAFGARRIRLSTLGILQYCAPSIVFLLGIFIYNEPFGVTQFITFFCIWVALFMYTLEGGVHFERKK